MPNAWIAVDGRRHPLSLVIFDMDGTLTESKLDFAAIKKEAGVPEDAFLLEYLKEVSPERQAGIMEVIRRHEVREAHSCELRPDTEEVLKRLKRQGLKLAILTRNCRECSEVVVDRFALSIDAIFAREDAPPKPDPESVLTVCGHCSVPPEETLVVGDYVFDVQAGSGAGALTALLLSERTRELAWEADLRLEALSDLMTLMEFDGVGSNT